MEDIRRDDMTVWPVSEIQPVLMRAREDADLLEPVSWTYASRLTAVDAFPSDRLDYFGVPFFTENSDYLKGQLNCPPVGWLETNVVQFTDPDHYWYDPEGRTFHLWASSYGRYRFCRHRQSSGERRRHNDNDAGDDAFRQTSSVCPVPGRANEVSSVI